MPTIPSWARCCDFWAPEIHFINDYFFLYYTARDSTGKLTIGAAYSKDILGPYTDKGSPIVTNSS
jgi:beta-xylosidase